MTTTRITKMLEAAVASDAEYFGQATRHTPLDMLQAGEFMAHIMSGGAPTTTMKSNTGNLIVRWKETDDAVLILGVIAKQDKIIRGDLQDLKEWVALLTQKIRDGKMLLTSPNQNSRPMIARIVSRLKAEGCEVEEVEAGGNLMLKLR